MAAFGVGDVERGKCGFGADLYLVRVELLQGDCVKVVAFFGVACMDQSEWSNESCDTTSVEIAQRPSTFTFNSMFPQ